jgi:hypothetical protein
MAIADAHTEREPITTDPETQQPLFAIITSILAVPIGRTRRDQPLDRVTLLFIGPMERDGRRILIEPGGRDGIDRQGVESDSPKHAVEIGGKQGIEDLPQPVIMKRGACEAGLEQRYHLTLLQAWPDLIENMMTIENRQEQGLHPTPTRQDMGGVRRAEGINERRHVELADHPQHQRHVGHGLDLLHRDRHEAPLLQVFSKVAS